MTPEEDPIFSPREAGECCNVDRTTITAWIKRKGLKAQRMPGGYFRIRKSDLDAFLSRYDIYREVEQEKSKAPTILIVDDEEQVRISVEAALEDHFQIILAASGEECIKILKETRPSLIMLDIMMPGMDGYAVCREIKSNRNIMDIPILMVSAKTAEVDIVKGFETGASDYIRKPYGTQELLARISNLLKN